MATVYKMKDISIKNLKVGQPFCGNPTFFINLLQGHPADLRAEALGYIFRIVVAIPK